MQKERNVRKPVMWADANTDFIYILPNGEARMIRGILRASMFRHAVVPSRTFWQISPTDRTGSTDSTGRAHLVLLQPIPLKSALISESDPSSPGILCSTGPCLGPGRFASLGTPRNVYRKPSPIFSTSAIFLQDGATAPWKQASTGCSSRHHVNSAIRQSFRDS